MPLLGRRSDNESYEFTWGGFFGALLLLVAPAFVWMYSLAQLANDNVKDKAGWPVSAAALTGYFAVWVIWAIKNEKL